MGVWYVPVKRGVDSAGPYIYIYNCHHIIVFFLIWGLHVDILVKYTGKEELRYIYIKKISSYPIGKVQWKGRVEIRIYFKNDRYSPSFNP